MLFHLYIAFGIEINTVSGTVILHSDPDILHCQNLDLAMKTSSHPVSFAIPITFKIIFISLKFYIVPLLSDQELISSQFIDADDGSDEAAAAAAGAAALAALAAADRDRKFGQSSRDPFSSS